MKKLFLFALIAFLSINLYAQKIPYMTQIDKQELRYMDNSPLSIQDWNEYMFYQEREYGKTSKEYLAIIPNIEEFNSHYKDKYQLLKDEKKNNYVLGSNEKYLNKKDKMPIVGISPKQLQDYCNWRTKVYNYKVGKKYKIIFTTPNAQDYEKASKFRKIKGIKEGKDIGFRCVANIVK